MTYPSGFHMPGAFYSDGSNGGAPTVSQPTLFHTSVSSAAAAAATTASGSYRDISTPKRKRARGGIEAAAESQEGGLGLFGAAHVLSKPRTPIRPYNMAGTLDTPSPANSGLLEDSVYSETNYRTALGSGKRSRQDTDDISSTTGGSQPTPLFQLPHEPDSPSRGWGASAVDVIGGVVGKVWEFCKAGAFKGFYAGGGTGFSVHEDGTVALDTNNNVVVAGDGYGFSFHATQFDDYEQRVPGRYPASQHDYYQDSTRSSTPVGGPAAKRRHTDQPDDLGRNWVLVNGVASEAAAARPVANSATPRKSSLYRASPRNRNQAPSVTTGRRISNTPGSAPSRRSSIIPSYGYRPPSVYAEPAEEEEELAAPRPASSASFACPRSPSPIKGLGKPIHMTPSSANAASTASNASPSQYQPRSGGGGGGHRRRGSQITSTTTPSHRRNHSSASTASGRGDELDAHASPRLDAEARHLATRRKKDDRDADVRISAFNKRLQDMIRQGKEALGTTIEIDDNNGGEGGETGWEDEE